jgi:hypothetical protein
MQSMERPDVLKHHETGVPLPSPSLSRHGDSETAEKKKDHIVSCPRRKEKGETGRGKEKAVTHTGVNFLSPVPPPALCSPAPCGALLAPGIRTPARGSSLGIPYLEISSPWMLYGEEVVAVVSVVGVEVEVEVGVVRAFLPSTCPRSRVGSMTFRTRFLSSFVSAARSM